MLIQCKGYGADGVSALVGNCRKIELLYPPSENNLVAIWTVDGQRGKLARIMYRLEAGIMVKTTAAQSLYIPDGCIHATFTLQSGFSLQEILRHLCLSAPLVLKLPVA